MGGTRAFVIGLLSAVAFSGCSSSSNGGGPDSGPVDSGPTTVTLNGTVVDELGHGLGGEAVIIASGTAFSQSTVSDASGAFSVANVPTPYNATVVDGTGKSAIQYIGLTRADPTLLTLVSAPSGTRSATLSGALTG